MKQTDTDKPERTTRWRQDPENTKKNIIEIASREFAEHGLAGARIDRIAQNTATSKRMIYYYFTDKEGLYLSCLEQSYLDVRVGERELNLEKYGPADALRILVEFMFKHHNANPDFVRMVMIENIHRASFLSKSQVIRQHSVSSLTRIAIIYKEGVAQGIFREGLDSDDIHWTMNSIAFFNVSNRATFEQLLGKDLSSQGVQDARCAEAVDTIMRYVLKL